MNQLHSKSKNKLLIILFVSLILIFVVLQLFVLTNVGTKGERVSYLKRRQSEIKIENEIKKAKILDLQTNQAVLDGLKTSIKLQEKNVIYLDPDQYPIQALKNE